MNRCVPHRQEADSENCPWWTPLDWTVHAVKSLSSAPWWVKKGQLLVDLLSGFADVKSEEVLLKDEHDDFFIFRFMFECCRQ